MLSFSHFIGHGSGRTGMPHTQLLPAVLVVVGVLVVLALLAAAQVAGNAIEGTDFPKSV
jgi:hypothetical protein